MWGFFYFLFFLDILFLFLYSAIQPLFEIVSLSHSKVVRIEFGFLRIQQPQPDTDPGVFDRIHLKNGYSLSGHLQTKTFTLRAPYGTFDLETPQIIYIDFDAMG